MRSTARLVMPTILPDLPVDRRMTYGQMRRAVLDLHVVVASAILPGDLMGCYDRRRDVILVDRRLTYRAKRCVLVHELVHWAHGDDGEYARGLCEARTRRETALTLIDPAEYALAERTYDGNPWAIADELDVTMQVIRDYRSVLSGSRIMVSDKSRQGRVSNGKEAGTCTGMDIPV
ncbi:ImmA/IrrE family metallo-endopeptidase [uncultured Bifidobacterium sp.]|uniref:ImmA/IrrE family metallo-endopeptidase n=1 Tax=uncultured Bifidobacterium sp. TaxID=165187 RepID=UPI002583347E|nr:ImmA/IrrE family metallo-endopeptidase [uncultured Bifidobacterium sp.]